MRFALVSLVIDRLPPSIRTLNPVRRAVRRAGAWLGIVVATLLATTAATVAVHATSHSAMTAAAKVSTKKLPKLGVVLVNAHGRTLYMFVPDKRRKVICVGSCTQVWSPLKLPNGTKPVAAGQATALLLGSDPDPQGGRVVTYNGWPLYTYITDTSAGTAKGQAP